MSLIDSPLALLERVIGRHEPPPADDPLVRRIERAVRRLEPDPLYRRRLRGEVVNRYVARREGLIAHPLRRREMGRLGRAVLYASTATAVSVTGVGAASQEALPGDALYSVKVQLEEIRIRVAPASLLGDLAILALDERVEELQGLAAAGRWDSVDDAAMAVVAAEERLAAMDVDPGADRVWAHVAVLEAVLARAPAPAAEPLAQAIQASSRIPSHAGPAGGETPGTPPVDRGSQGDRDEPRPTPPAEGSVNAGSAEEAPATNKSTGSEPQPTESATSSASPEPSAKPEPPAQAEEPRGGKESGEDQAAGATRRPSRD
jgi:hypothetical protein